jgi:uncharacterized protein (TIGR00369 family)
MIIDPTPLHPIVNVDGQTCFGCGDDNPIGLHMHFSTDDERVYSLVTVPPAMAGWDQTVHGGVLSTLLDEIMGWSVIYLLGKIGVTKTMTVEFRKPVQVGRQLTVVGAIRETVSERQVVVSGEIYSDEDVLCARATGTFAAMTPQAAVRLGVMSNAYMERFLPILQQKQEPGHR